MKQSEVRFLRVKMSNSGATNGNIHHVPLEAISEIKKTPAADASTAGSVTIKYNAGSATTLTATTDTAGTQVQMNTMIDAVENELISCIEALSNGSKNIVTVPWSEGNCLAGTLNAGLEATVAKFNVTQS